MNDQVRTYAQQIIAESAIEAQNIKIATLVQEKKILESKIEDLLSELEKINKCACAY